LPPFNFPFMDTIPVPYHSLKKKYPDAILLFRTGDFYQAFGEDAKALSKLTGIPLVDDPENRKTMQWAKLPFHALDAALRTLVKNGYKVAICESLEGPKNKKGAAKNDP
jgi:DNA mismatch repair protein MutS